MGIIQFSITNWHAASPGKTCKDDWHSNKLKEDLGHQERTIACDLIPAMMRRRMSSVSKLAVQTALTLTHNEQPDFIVFSSRHGELPRTVKLVESILNDEDASPMVFSQSVHNTAAGLYTIAAKYAVPVTSVSAGEDSLHAALIEAAAHLKCHPQDRILVVDFDEAMPHPYDRFDNFKHDGYALGMLLTSGDEFTVRASPQKLTKPHVPQAFIIIDALLGNIEQWQVPSHRNSWQWQK